MDLQPKIIPYKLYKLLPTKIRLFLSYFLADKFIVGIFAFVVKNNKLLLVKHSYQEGWSLPSGFLNRSETFYEAIKREIKEEVGLTVKVKQILDVRNVIGNPYIDIAVICELVKGKVRIDNKEVVEAKFFEINNLPKNILTSNKPYVRSFKKVIKSEKFKLKTPLVVRKVRRLSKKA